LPKQSPIPDDSDKVFWEACNNDKLLVQYCSACSYWQYPPRPVCPSCGKADNVSWKEPSGRGTIHSYGVIYDSPIKTMQAEQPYNTAIIQMEEDPGVLFLSNLPGTPVDEVVIGAKVEIMFEVTPATGQKVPEWRVVG